MILGSFHEFFTWRRNVLWLPGYDAVTCVSVHWFSKRTGSKRKSLEAPGCIMVSSIEPKQWSSSLKHHISAVPWTHRIRTTNRTFWMTSFHSVNLIVFHLRAPALPLCTVSCALSEFVRVLSKIFDLSLTGSFSLSDTWIVPIFMSNNM